MDWFSWLSKTNLEPCLVREYSLSFSKNELEHEDIAYFNHEFLQSMGISIAKHRLEILKLARRHTKKPPLLASRVAVAIKKTGKRFSDHVRAWIARGEEESSSSRALVLVPKRSSGKWRGGGFFKRNNNNNKKRSHSHVMPSEKQERLLLTNGTTPCRDSFEYSPMVFDYSFKDFEDTSYLEKDEEEIKWDSMFQNLKPT